MSTACVILAAGLGKRMKSGVPKVLHLICGITMLDSVVGAARKVNAKKIVVVAGAHMDAIRKSLEADDVVFAHQKEAKGTGHALRCAGPALTGFRGTVVVLNGDTPLIGPETIKRFLRLHSKGKNDLSVLSFRAEHPKGYGRIVRDAEGRFSAIVEEKDADPSEKKICEVNSGVYAFESEALGLLDSLRMNKAKGEYYLTDIAAEAVKRGMGLSAYCIGAEEEFMGVNTKEELALASLLMRASILKKWAGRGVNFIDPKSVFIHAGVIVGRDATIYPNVHLEGRTKIGNGATIFPNVRILNSDIGAGAVIKDSTVIEDSKVMDRAAIGPFAHLRPGSEVGADARVGNFVELKKAVIGKASKASHLSYLGDTVIGRHVNVGAGTITCNYDGVNKHKTVMGDGVFIGSDTQLVAPVKIGRGAYVGAGSTITEDVPAGALALSRTRQKNIRGWAKKRGSAAKGKGPKNFPGNKKES